MGMSGARLEAFMQAVARAYETVENELNAIVPSGEAFETGDSQRDTERLQLMDGSARDDAAAATSDPAAELAADPATHAGLSDAAAGARIESEEVVWEEAREVVRLAPLFDLFDELGVLPIDSIEEGTRLPGAWRSIR